jgi:transcriptional regulator with XRE-family HTH domain
MANATGEDRPLRSFVRSNRFLLGARAFGAKIRELRLRKGWTLERAAERMQLDFAHLQKIEAGRINVTLATFLRIADGLGEPPELLFELVSSGQPSSRGTSAAQRQALTRGPGLSRKQTSKYGARQRSRDREVAVQREGDRILRDLGRRVAELRNALGLNQREFAELVGISVPYLQRIESGRQNLTMRSLARLAWGLGVPALRLLEPPSGVRYPRKNARTGRTRTAR